MLNELVDALKIGFLLFHAVLKSHDNSSSATVRVGRFLMETSLSENASGNRRADLTSADTKTPREVSIVVAANGLEVRNMLLQYLIPMGGQNLIAVNFVAELVDLSQLFELTVAICGDDIPNGPQADVAALIRSNAEQNRRGLLQQNATSTNARGRCRDL